MSKCPNCNHELIVVEGSVKFAAQLGDSKREEDCCDMSEKNSKGLEVTMRIGAELLRKDALEEKSE